MNNLCDQAIEINAYQTAPCGHVVHVTASKAWIARDLFSLRSSRNEPEGQTQIVRASFASAVVGHAMHEGMPLHGAIVRVSHCPSKCSWVQRVRTSTHQIADGRASRAEGADTTDLAVRCLLRVLVLT